MFQVSLSLVALCAGQVQSTKNRKIKFTDICINDLQHLHLFTFSNIQLLRPLCLSPLATSPDLSLDLLPPPSGNFFGGSFFGAASGNSLFGILWDLFLERPSGNSLFWDLVVFSPLIRGAFISDDLVFVVCFSTGVSLNKSFSTLRSRDTYTTMQIGWEQPLESCIKLLQKNQQHSGLQDRAG